jgi:hypothetical protein
MKKNKHDIIPLQIMRASRYYKELKNKNELDQWDNNPLYALFPVLMLRMNKNLI